MPAVYESRFTVDQESIDSNGHVNNVAYVRWMQDAAVAHSAAQGWDLARYLEHGLTWMVRSHFIEYLAQGFCGDRIVVRTWVTGFRRIRSTRKYKVSRLGDDVALARGETEWVLVDTHGRPNEIPLEMKASFVVVPPVDEP